MIRFYLTKTGEYNPGSIDDVSNSIILDDKNKTMKVMGEYDFTFQRLDASYTSDVDSSLKGLSIYGAGLMYDELLGHIGDVTDEIDLIETSIGHISSSIGTLNASVSSIENTLPVINGSIGIISSSIGRIESSVNAVEDAIADIDETYVHNASMGIAGGVATLDENGNVPSSQLPSFVDDIIEGYKDGDTFYEDSAHEHAITPSSGKIYVDLVTNTSWRWGGSAYVQVSESLALGETPGTAYEGSKGAATTSTVNTHVADTDIHITAAERTAWNNASTKAHEHSNKAILDGITDSSFHTHSNKSILDGLTDSSISDWNNASDKAHTHSNKDILDSLTSTDIDNFADASNKKHEHSNKAVLDGITSTQVSGWDDAASKAHEHTNAGILNGITDASIEDWMGGNVQADWDATSGDASILNRPELGSAATEDVYSGTITSETTSDDLATAAQVASYGADKVNAEQVSQAIDSSIKALNLDDYMTS